MATVSVLKLTQVQGVVKVRGTGNGTIALATTLKKSTETQSSPVVNIRSLFWSCSSGTEATVTRNSEVLWYLTGQGDMEFAGWSDNEENDQDIVIDFGAGTGTVVVELTKVSGYGPQAHQGADGDLG